MNKLNRLLLSISLFLLINACATYSSTTPSSSDLTQDKPNNTIIVSAKKPVSTATLNLKEIKGASLTDQALWQRVTVRHFSLEGGFYGLITESGGKLLPMNLAQEYRIDGSIIEVKGNIVDVMTIQQWGMPFKITDIKLIKEGKGGNNSLL